MNPLLIELPIIAYALCLWLFMRKQGYSNVTRKFIILFLGILLFEIISEPMWLNIGFDSWAYIYRDITWVITLGWVGILMSSIILVDYTCQGESKLKKFLFYIIVAEVITVPIEFILIQTGMRGYAPVLMDQISGLNVPFTFVPIEAIYAFPLFTFLIIGFYKYINYIVGKNE